MSDEPAHSALRPFLLQLPAEMVQIGSFSRFGLPSRDNRSLSEVRVRVFGDITRALIVLTNGSHVADGCTLFGVQDTDVAVETAA